eukprot:SAG31_NODE_25633_length_457_cov_1.486034_1_plen_48_part_10
MGVGDDVQGQLPPSMAAFTHLVALSIVSTQMVGPLPEELGHLPALRMV